MVTQDLQCVDILRSPANDSFQESDFDIQVAQLSARHFFASDTTFLRHTTSTIVSKHFAQVKYARASRASRATRATLAFFQSANHQIAGKGPIQAPRNSGLT